MEQLETQCCLLHGATHEADNSSFFPANEDDKPPLPLERKPKSSCSDLRNTSTATLQVWRPLGAGDQVRGQCRLQTEAWRHCAPRENQHQATEHHRTGSVPKENSLGGSRTDPGAEREAHCSQVPTSVERGAREKQGENEASDHA